MLIKNIKNISNNVLKINDSYNNKFIVKSAIYIAGLYSSLLLNFSFKEIDNSVVNLMNEKLKGSIKIFDSDVKFTFNILKDFKVLFLLFKKSFIFTKFLIDLDKKVKILNKENFACKKDGRVVSKKEIVEKKLFQYVLDNQIFKNKFYNGKAINVDFFDEQIYFDRSDIIELPFNKYPEVKIKLNSKEDILSLKGGLFNFNFLDKQDKIEFEKFVKKLSEVAESDRFLEEDFEFCLKVFINRYRQDSGCDFIDFKDGYIGFNVNKDILEEKSGTKKLKLLGRGGFKRVYSIKKNGIDYVIAVPIDEGAGYFIKNGMKIQSSVLKKLKTPESIEPVPESIFISDGLSISKTKIANSSECYLSKQYLGDLSKVFELPLKDRLTVIKLLVNSIIDLNQVDNFRHVDFKFGNISLDRKEDGSFRVSISDFDDIDQTFTHATPDQLLGSYDIENGHNMLYPVHFKDEAYEQIIKTILEYLGFIQLENMEISSLSGKSFLSNLVEVLDDISKVYD